jgi:hypothetical protein
MSFFQALLASSDDGLLATDDFIPVILSWGQSNEIGRAEFGRYLDLTPYTFDPIKVKGYWKTDYTTTDNGQWSSMQVGSAMTREYDLSSFTTYGSYVTAAIKLAAILNKTVYVIPVADGGTVVNTLGTYRTWNDATSAECFDVAMDRFYQVAIDKLQVEFPGKQIVVFITVTEGETDAFQTRTQLQFFNDVTSIMTAMRSYEQLSTALLVVQKINYMQNSDEDTINAAWDDYLAANPDRVRIVETSDLVRKTDLTVTEKGGISPSTGADDEHISYLGQNEKGLRVAEAIRSFYGWADVSLTPSSTNTAFDPTSIGTVHIRLQGSSGKVTQTANKYTLTGITNDGSIGTFAINNGTIHYKQDDIKGWINSNLTLSSGSNNLPRVQTTAAVGTSLFNHSFSIAGWVRPRDGNPTAFYSLVHDIQNTASVNNSRVLVGIATDGKVYALYAVGGTAVQAQTNTAVFTDNTQTAAAHLTWTFTSGGLIRIYVNGVLQTLDAVLNGNISALTMANYVNATNTLTLFATRGTGSSYNNHFYGHVRELMIQPVVYSTTDIANLMLN